MLFHSDLEMSSFFRHSKCQKSRLIRGTAEEGEEAFSRGSTCERTNKMLNRYMAQWRKKAQRPCKVFFSPVPSSLLSRSIFIVKLHILFKIFLLLTSTQQVLSKSPSMVICYWLWYVMNWGCGIAATR